MPAALGAWDTFTQVIHHLAASATKQWVVTAVMLWLSVLQSKLKGPTARQVHPTRDWKHLAIYIYLAMYYYCVSGNLEVSRASSPRRYAKP